MRRTLAGIVLAMGVPALAAGAPRALVRSGERVAGVAIGGIDRVAALDRRALALRVTSSSLTVSVGGATRTVVATGDRLPSPLTGTFQAIQLAASHPSGVVAFAASVNSPEAGVGIFVVRGRRIVPALLLPQRARAV